MVPTGLGAFLSNVLFSVEPRPPSTQIWLLRAIYRGRGVNRIPTFLLQNPAARAGPWLSYTKPETVRRDGSNEVTWACSESLLALLFTHHRFLLNRSIAAGRARARPIRKFAPRSIAWSSWVWRGFWWANPPRTLRACSPSVPGLGVSHRTPTA